MQTVGELSLQGPLILQYGLFYNYLTNSSETSLLGSTTKVTTVAHVLDLPVELLFTVPFSQGFECVCLWRTQLQCCYL